MDIVQQTTLLNQDTHTTVWQGCYSEGWDSDLLTPEAFSHPAKFSKSLITRIINYMLERGYIQPGQTILDPFGGVGLGAVATFYGLNWVGVELEQKFHDIGNGCQCTGLSAEEYRRFFARFRPDAIHKLNGKGGRHLKDTDLGPGLVRHFCPACLASLGKVEEAPTLPLSYQSKKRRARIAELQKRIGKRLGRVVSLVDPLPFPEKYRPTSSTYSLFDEPESGPIYRRNSGRIPTVQPHTYEGNLSRFKKYAQPGTTARLIQGDSRRLRARLAEVMGGLVSSPPYAGMEVNPGNVGNAIRKETWGKGKSLAAHKSDYGSSSGQLGNLSEGSLADSLVTSPPFAGNTGGRGEASRNGIDAALFDRHSGGMKRGTGENPDNLDHLPMRGFGDALGGLVASPPYSHPAKTGETKEDSWSDGRSRPVGASQRNNGGYGKSKGQLGAMPTNGFDAALSSPPFSDSVGSDLPEKRGGLLRTDPKRAGDRNLTGSYGSTAGQLGAMPAGGLDALASSPPFENQNACNDPKYQSGRTNGGGPLHGDYGKADGQLGIEQGQTFWAAARLIVTESYLALKPGAYSAWVLKAFIRDHERVDFPGQWRQLCEVCGFEYAEEIRAMQVSEAKYQGDLSGGVNTIQKATKSFFRRTYEKKFPNNRIDWEVVLIMRKPEAAP